MRITPTLLLSSTHPASAGFFSPFFRELVSSLMVGLAIGLVRDGRSSCGKAWSWLKRGFTLTKYCLTVRNQLCSLCSLMFTGE